MLIFAAQPYYERFARMLAEADPDSVLGKFSMMRFPDKEVCAAVREAVGNKDCLIAGTIASPDSQLAEFLMLADALKRGGARSIVAYLPYLAYARQDKFAPGQSGGIATIGSLFRAVGVDAVIAIDVHSELSQNLIGLPVTSISPAPHLFVDEVRALGWSDVTVVAPDEGAVRRSQELAEALGVERPVAYLAKRRASISHLGFKGEVSPRAVVADDILDSGHTLVSACNMLRQNGVREIAVAVTHGLFTGEIWKELFDVGVTSLFVTDSCPQANKTEAPQVKIVSIKPLIPQVLAAARKETSHEFIAT